MLLVRTNMGFIGHQNRSNLNINISINIIRIKNGKQEHRYIELRYDFLWVWISATSPRQRCGSSQFPMLMFGWCESLGCHESFRLIFCHRLWCSISPLQLRQCHNLLELNYGRVWRITKQALLREDKLLCLHI